MRGVKDTTANYFSPMEMEKVRQRPPRQHLAELPSPEELEEVISKIKNGKAGGSSGILPVMVKITTAC